MAAVTAFGTKTAQNVYSLVEGLTWRKGSEPRARSATALRAPPGYGGHRPGIYAENFCGKTFAQSNLQAFESTEAWGIVPATPEPQHREETPPPPTGRSEASGPHSPAWAPSWFRKAGGSSQRAAKYSGRSVSSASTKASSGSDPGRTTSLERPRSPQRRRRQASQPPVAPSGGVVGTSTSIYGSTGARTRQRPRSAGVAGRFSRTKAVHPQPGAKKDSTACCLNAASARGACVPGYSGHVPGVCNLTGICIPRAAKEAELAGLRAKNWASTA